jgi:hypothetical protein
MTDGKLKAVFGYHGKGGANCWMGEKRRPAKRSLLFRSWTRRRLVVSLVLVATLLNTAFVRAQSRPAPVAASEGPGIIACVRPSTHDMPRISPDGTGDRVLWAAPRPLARWPVQDLAWRPDGRELAFPSEHEETCSWCQSDVYAIGYNGAGYRHVTNAPACAALAGLPMGSVTVNVIDSVGPLAEGYVQGAPGPRSAENGTMTFDNVADLGPGVLRRAVGIYIGAYGEDRAKRYPPYADTQPNQTVPGGNLIITEHSASERTCAAACESQTDSIRPKGGLS